MQRDGLKIWYFFLVPDCSLRVPASLPGIGRELHVGSQTHAHGAWNPYIMDVALMMPPETRTVWLLYDMMHGPVCHTRMMQVERGKFRTS